MTYCYVEMVCQNKLINLFRSRYSDVQARAEGRSLSRPVKAANRSTLITEYRRRACSNPKRRRRSVWNGRKRSLEKSANHQLTNQSINQSNNQRINQSINQTINRTINRSTEAAYGDLLEVSKARSFSEGGKAIFFHCEWTLVKYFSVRLSATPLREVSSIFPCRKWKFSQSINQSINQSIKQLISRSINRSINQSSQ